MKGKGDKKEWKGAGECVEGVREEDREWWRGREERLKRGGWRG